MAQILHTLCSVPSKAMLMIPQNFFLITLLSNYLNRVLSGPLLQQDSLGWQRLCELMEGPPSVRPSRDCHDHIFCLAYHINDVLFTILCSKQYFFSRGTCPDKEDQALERRRPHLNYCPTIWELFCPQKKGKKPCWEMTSGKKALAL